MAKSRADALNEALDAMEKAKSDQNTSPSEKPLIETTGDKRGGGVSSSDKSDKTALKSVRFKQIGGHFHIDVHKAIALIGVNEDRTIQSLAAEAFEDLLRKRESDQSILELTKLTRPTKK